MIWDGWRSWAATLSGQRPSTKRASRSPENWADSHLALALLEGLACDAGAKGEAERAARLFGATQALREATGFPLEPAMRALEEPYLVGARSQLEEGAWTAAWEEGRAMSMETAIEYALSEEEPSTITSSAAPTEQLSTPVSEHPAGLTPREVEVLGLVARRAHQPTGRPKTLPEPPNSPEAPQLRLPQAGGELSDRSHASRPRARPPLKLTFQASLLFSLLLMGICPLPHIGNMGMPIGPFGRSLSNSAAP